MRTGRFAAQPHSGLHRREARSFDHLVGEREHIGRNFEAERLCGIEVDDKFELGGLHHRQVRWLFTPDNLARVDADLTICIDKAGAIADQAASDGKSATKVSSKPMRLVKKPPN
jgi:hypothetical protein